MLTIVKSILLGLTMVILGTGPWAVMVGLNVKYLPGIPWAALVMPFYLWLYWKFATGKTWPASNADARRSMCRANEVSADAWLMAIVAGFAGLLALIQFQNVYSRLVTLPTGPADDLSTIPMHTLVPTVVVSAVVAGMTEESSMRGYLQGPIEKKFGPLIAITITAIVFGLLHFVHSEVNLTVMPWYMGVAIIYGAMAWKTNSILPSTVLHAGGNMLNAVSVLGQGRTEWQTTANPSLIWETGTDSAFWFSVLLFFVLLTVSFFLFRQVNKS